MTHHLFASSLMALMASAERQPLNEAQAAHLIKMTLEEQRSVTSRPFTSGDRIGNYVLRKLLGKGAFGMVWQADQMEPVKREVALKILRPGLDIEESSDRFRIEGCALARMNHPGIAAVLDIGSLPSGEPYFVMELVKGGPITKYCENKGLNLRQRLQLMVQVCHAVQHAHQRAVLHRDLKPSNILVAEVDGQPVPKVIDFGIAKPMTDEVTGDLTLARTVRGMMLGTPRYMAPEQASLTGGTADVRADVYALGTILYELITGVTPVSDDDVSTTALPALLKRICEDEAKRPSLLTRQLPATRSAGFTVRDLQELDWVVLKALEKQPDRRYPSADALADDLISFCDHQPLSVGPPEFGYRVHKLIQRHRGPVAATLLMMVCMTIAAFVSINAFLEESKAHQLAERSSAESAANERRATAAVEFLSDILQESGRQIGEGANATALRAALKNGEERLKDIKSQPSLVATLCEQMAFTYEAMGDISHSVPLREKAVSIFTTMQGPDAIQTLEARARLATALANNGQQAKALPVFEDLATRWSAKGSAFNGKVFETRRRMAHALSAIARIPEAMAIMRSLMDAPDDRGRPGRENLSFMRAMAEMLANSGDLAGAHQTLQDCLDRIQDKTSPAFARTRASLLLSLARVEVKEKDFAQAASHYLEYMKVSREAGQGDHKSQIDILIETARTLQSAGRFDQAMSCLDEAESIARKADNRSQLSHCYSTRAQICKADGRNELSVAPLRAFIANTDDNNPSSPRLWRENNRILVDCLMSLGRHEEAREVAVQYWDRMRTDPRVKDEPELWASTLTKMISVVMAWKKATQSTAMDSQVAEWQATVERLMPSTTVKSGSR